MDSQKNGASRRNAETFWAKFNLLRAILPNTYSHTFNLYGKNSPFTVDMMTQIDHLLPLQCTSLSLHHLFAENLLQVEY